MSWAVGYDGNWNRDIGYGVPATCDHPRCDTKINRGLAYVCGEEPYGGETGCGLFFCEKHLSGWRRDVRVCPRCAAYKPPYKRPSADTEEWLRHKLTHPSWEQWRQTSPGEVKAARAALES